MAHHAQRRRVAGALALLLAGCGTGHDNVSDAGPAGNNVETQAPAPAGSQAVVYQDFINNGTEWLDSNLYAVNEDGTAARVLAGSERREHFRGTSPDGWVIYDRYLSTGNDTAHLYSVSLGSGETRVLDDAAEAKLFRAVTPDGRVVYEKSTATGTALYSIAPDGNARRVLADLPNVVVEYLAAAPSGRLVYTACERQQTDPEAPPRCLPRGLYSVAPDGTDTRTLAEGAATFAQVTALDRVIYTQSADGAATLYSVRADGTDRVGLVSAPEPLRFDGSLPDGRLLYGRQNSQQWDVYLVNADGSGARLLLGAPEDEFVTGITGSGRIVFVRGASGARDLYSIEPDGTGIAVLGDSGDDERLARLTADGRVIYATRRRAGEYVQDDLYAISADGTGLQVIADTSDFEWFEDEGADGRVVYMRCVAAPGGPCEHPSAQSDLYSVRSDGTERTGLATTSEFEVFRTLTQNNRIIYERIVGDQRDIAAVDSDGSDARSLTSSPVDERYQALH